MFDVLKRLVRDEAAQDLAEYGIALSVIAAGIGVVILAVAGQVNTLWNNASGALTVVGS